MWTQPRDDVEASWHRFALCAGSVLALLALFFVPAVAPALLKAEHWAADWRTAFLSDRLPSAHPKFAIIAVTEQSLEDFPYILPINRGYIADIVAAADQAGARAIGLDFFFTKDTEKQNDDKLLEALRRAKDKVVLGVFEDPRRQAQLAYQSDFIARVGARSGYIDLLPDRDQVIRYRATPRSAARYRESFSAVLSKSLGWSGGAVPERIAWLLPPADGGSTFLKIQAHNLLKASADERAALLNGRIVLIGGELFTLDRHFTPLSPRFGGMRGVEVHAHMAAELVDGGRSYSELGTFYTNTLLAGLSLLGIALGLRFQARRFDFLDWRVASLGVIALDLILFKFLHHILPFTLSAVAWIVGVTAGTQLRHAIAWSRARWSGAT
jgi:CHASE2 domain-containing sensor protein